MHIGLVGAGRMGQALAGRLSRQGGFTLRLFDRNMDIMQLAAERYGAETATSIEEMANLRLVILAVPDKEIINCLEVFKNVKKPPVLLNIATNVSQQRLNAAVAESHLTCIGVKFVGHAGEIALGERPIIIVDESGSDFFPVIKEIFQTIGEVMIGDSDIVTKINTIAAEEVLIAGVHIENRLREQSISDPLLINSAIRQVAAGTLKAFANGDLGPFAREIVNEVRIRINQRM
ncbi:hypothetical protein P22_1031 [Propionispora sp. 2/2-37]|uniref:NAD(P)-binding domain-containing protein n=1 Tax=Propionispora sp. 2/2-37 TaxID=1677858 RepID=UPI0006BB6EAB|nr:NAD(P)-binding domain-containing protein [Propionispora sp. 2/2-37]CUH94962.1 hypothetical protein P22_1031 [Propionispora sp. 2/2-37]